MPKTSKDKESNDNIPDDELLVAKLIQNAQSRGLVSCRGSRFKTTYGIGLFSMAEGIADDDWYACCAMGAASLEEDTTVEVSQMLRVIVGNDSLDVDEFYHVDMNDEISIKGVNVGAAFEQALRP